MNREQRSVVVMGFDPDYNVAQRKARLRAAMDKPFADTTFLFDIMEGVEQMEPKLRDWLLQNGVPAQDVSQLIGRISNAMVATLPKPLP